MSNSSNSETYYNDLYEKYEQDKKKNITEVVEEKKSEQRINGNYSINKSSSKNERQNFSSENQNINEEQKISEKKEAPKTNEKNEVQKINNENEVNNNYLIFSQLMFKNEKPIKNDNSQVSQTFISLATTEFNSNILKNYDEEIKKLRKENMKLKNDNIGWIKIVAREMRDNLRSKMKINSLEEKNLELKEEISDLKKKLKKESEDNKMKDELKAKITEIFKKIKLNNESNHELSNELEKAINLYQSK